MTVLMLAAEEADAVEAGEWSKDGNGSVTD